MSSAHPKPHRGMAMEGLVARWYARNTAGDAEDVRGLAGRLAEHVAASARLLEVASGPGYLALELARLGHRVTGVDISRTFVALATETARATGVDVTFRLADAHRLPFPDGSFDAVVCRAAFKNFSDPVAALREMRRVLAPGAVALIVDMRRDVSDAAIDDFVRSRGGGALDGLVTRWTFKHMLRRWAYTADEMRALAVEAGFNACDIAEASIGMEVWLRP